MISPPGILHMLSQLMYPLNNPRLNYRGGAKAYSWEDSACPPSLHLHPSQQNPNWVQEVVVVVIRIGSILDIF